MLSFHNKLILTRSSLHLRSSKWFNSKSGLDQVEQKLSKIHSCHKYKGNISSNFFEIYIFLYSWLKVHRYKQQMHVRDTGSNNC